MISPYLSDAEIADICEPLKRSGDQVRHLERLGLLVKRKPNGRPLVARGEFERVMIGRQADTAVSGPSQPNRAALLQLIQKGKHGSPAQGR